ncbi:EcsC family protein [Actibacterium lipolyticum]|uniref:EcsC protein family protein n=1 Tax=Actibacterium lipolyticum TaxID=1524263 RepID=A0A238KM76_9RHOB|nr:EcsC family protein [Actibacterium lipolyticum]SMX43875.1 EcsC protein family protein [Actibacterium lipolyticum]
MTTTELTLTTDTDAALTSFARRYRDAGNVGMQVLSVVGGQAENLLERLPDRVKDQLETATERALHVSLDAAGRTRGGRLPDGGKWLNTAVTTAMGAAGGFGGLPTALAELPVTTTVLLRAIQGIAESHGFNPTQQSVRADCIRVFAAAGPLAKDDGADLGFLAARVTLTGSAVHGLIARVTPRLATALGQKLAAQTVPIIGAVAGAATNFAFTTYYQEMAHIQFGLQRLSHDTGIPDDMLIEELRLRIEAMERR